MAYGDYEGGRISVALIKGKSKWRRKDKKAHDEHMEIINKHTN